MNGDASLSSLKLTGLTGDSRKVEPGYLFAAIPGTVLDGRRFIADAVERGATAVLTTPDITLADAGLEDRPDVTLIHDANPRRRLARLAAAFYSPQPEVTVAVTGTNGKTSVAQFTRQLWQAMSTNAAAIGTLGVAGDGFDSDEGLTTPDPVDLHAMLGRMKQAGIDHVALEASSHGLDQYRLDGVRFTAAAFTNLTRDHLDYHGSMEAYRSSKLRLFEELLSRGGSAVVNTAAAEHDQIANIAAERRLRCISYGLVNGQIRCVRHAARTGGFDLDLDVMGERFTVDFPLPGAFQVENALAALGLVMAAGADARHAAPNLARLTGVRGRMERAAILANGASVYVDYSHTPDSIATALTALRHHTEARLHIVFGCGGDRDPGKRPMMGEAARRNADVVFVTDDNPRTEDPAAIREAAMRGCPDAANIGDRREAILQAMRGLGPGDVLCIAGKGHEQGQVVDSTTLPFDDATVARDCAALLGDGA